MSSTSVARVQQWHPNFVSFESPEDIIDGLRNLGQQIEKGDGPQSFQLAHGLSLKPFLLNKQKQYTPITCFASSILWHGSGSITSYCVPRHVSLQQEILVPGSIAEQSKQSSKSSRRISSN